MSYYVLTDAAEADIREIVRYTRAQWGAAQARRYLGDLEHCMERLANSDGAFTDMSALHSSLRMRRCKHHYVFCLPRDDAPALIVALFHERMDLMIRLADRLA